ncbi:unnamed protein product, partial [marine sediment metagenome]
MNKYYCRLTTFFIIMLIAVFSIQPVKAATIVPGDTLDEVELASYILFECDDECEVLTHVTDNASAIRMAACIRLGEIGTQYSITPLLDIVESEEENWEVRDEASFALWQIRYRDAIYGGYGESLLLEILNR